MLATELGEEVALLRINATGWMPSGAHNRAVSETLSIIIEHIHSHPRTILFVDEIDKLRYETPWNSYIRGELFELLDGRLPTGAKGISDGGLETDDEGTLTPSQASSVTKKLRFQTFIVGAGAFQDYYETTECGQIGFHPRPHTPPALRGQTAEIIAKKLPRELVNRFNSSVLLVPPLEPSHYHLIAEQAEKSLPAWIQAAFRDAASRRVQQAIAARSGCRFIEEALADALKCTKSPIPETTEPDPCAL